MTGILETLKKNLQTSKVFMATGKFSEVTSVYEASWKKGIFSKLFLLLITDRYSSERETPERCPYDAFN